MVRDGRRLETPPAPQRSTWPALRIQLAEPVNGRFEFESPCLRKSGKGCRYSQATLLKVYRSYLVGKPCSLLSPRAVKRCVDPATTPRGAESGCRSNSALPSMSNGAEKCSWITFQSSPCLR